MSFNKKVSSFVLVLGALITFSAFASEPTKMSLSRMENENQDFAVGMRFSPRRNELKLSFSWKAVNLLQAMPVKSLKYALYNTVTRKVLTKWIDFGHVGQSFPGDMGLSLRYIGTEARDSITQMKELGVAFSANVPTEPSGMIPVTHYISFGELCPVIPMQFYNEDKNWRGCF